MPDEVESQTPAPTSAAQKGPAKKPAKQPAKQAATKPAKQPAKKAATKSTAPKKAATKSTATKSTAPKKATKAPAARAGEPAAPRAAILSRLQELEQRISAEPPRAALPAEEAAADAPPRAVPRRRPPAKKAPAPRRTARPAATPAKAPAPVPEVAAALPGTEAIAQATPPASPVYDQYADPEPAPAEPAQPPPGGSGVRWVVAAIVVLLALSAGFGAAAAARNQPATWRSQSVVTLSPVSSAASPTAVPDGQVRYERRVESTSFTALAAFSAGVSAERRELRAPLQARAEGDGDVVIEARADSRRNAAALAASAARSLVLAVTSDEALVTRAEDRLTAAITTTYTQPEREKPSSRDVWLAGLLSALALLLVAALVVLLVRTPRR